MKASFQELAPGVGVVRVHTEGGDWTARAPYTWACTLQVVDGKAEIMGVTKAPSSAERAAVRALLYGMGVTEAVYEVKGIERRHS